MSEDKRDWAETEQCDEQRKPSKWLARLQRFVATERQKARPKANFLGNGLNRLRMLVLLKRQLLEHHIGSWLACLDELLVGVNRWQAKLPAVVITTNPVGITACNNLALNESLHDALLRCCCLTENEYRYWCKQEPDVQFESHINYWAWIKTSVPAVRAKEFHKFPIAKGSAYWLLRHGVSGLGEYDFFDCKVFEWDGMKPTLLTEHFRESVPSV